MKAAIKRIILKLFPELSAGYHLPMFAVVVAARETPTQGDIANEFRPFYAVDVQVLNQHGQPDKQWPILKDVMLPVPGAGHEQGQFAYPNNGTWVELAFAYGSPNKPFIRSILPHGLSLPNIQRGEQKWQQNAEAYQNIDKNGNWTRKTDQTITDKSTKRVIEALEVLETFHVATKNTKTNDTEIIGAVKRIEAFGAIILQSGGVLDLSAIDDIRITTKANQIIKVLGDTLSTTSGKQSHKAPKTWIGSNTENALKLMSELAQLVIDLSNQAASHSHPAHNTQPNQSSSFTTIGSDTNGVKGRVDVIAE